MTSITSTTPSLNSLYQTPSTPTQLPSENGDDGSKKIVIEVTPGEDNVDSGDRSQNTAQISISTPNREVAVEVSREQVFNTVERRAQKNSIENVVNGPGSNSGPIAKAVIAENLDPQEMQELAYLKVKTDQIETYANASQGNSGSSSTFTGYTSPGQDYMNSPAYQATQAKNAYMKQQFVFSTLDRMNISEEI